jgi:hypothetical protein
MVQHAAESAFTDNVINVVIGIVGSLISLWLLFCIKPSLRLTLEVGSPGKPMVEGHGAARQEGPQAGRRLGVVLLRRPEKGHAQATGRVREMPSASDPLPVGDREPRAGERGHDVWGHVAAVREIGHRHVRRRLPSRPC